MSSPALFEPQPRPTLSLRASVPMAEIGPKMGELLPAVWHQAQALGARPAGPAYSRYYSHGETVDFEAGMVLAAPVQADDPFRAGELPGGTVATLEHVGPYDSLRTSWEVLYGWLGGQALTPTAAWEEYLTDPGQEPDSSKWRTRLCAKVG